MPTESHLHTTNLSRHYKRGTQVVRALDDVTLDVGRGEFLALVGSSGSGKTTLLNLLAGLDTPTHGSVNFGGVSLSALSRRDLASYRARNVGMIFQSFNLISHYSALQNVETALFFNDTPRRERKRLASSMLEQLGLADRLGHQPAELSGGEQQRVAIARALVKKPEIIFADEPTGNLDFENAQQITSLLTTLNREHLTIVLVTHNLEMAQEHASRTVRLQYGRIVGSTIQSPKQSPTT
jgi:putative ABC transport system ATP-binding protein